MLTKIENVDRLRGAEATAVHLMTDTSDLLALATGDVGEAVEAVSSSRYRRQSNILVKRGLSGKKI